MDLALDLLAMDLTNDPDPVRFDGAPPRLERESVLLASLFDITGLMIRKVFADTGDDDAVYYYINDHLGTPRIIIDEANNIVWRDDYQPFGSVDAVVSDLGNHFRFPGQYYDEETGLHYNYQRYYDPNTGRYLRADPIGLLGGLNLYVYVNNNPVNLVDPYGLFVKHAFENSLPSWLRDSRSDAERESAHQEYNQDIGDRLSAVWDLTKIVTYPEKTIFWAPLHTYDKFTDQYPNDSYFDPWHHHYDSHEEDTDPCK